MEKSKNGKGNNSFIVIIVLLVIALIGLIVYICYDKGLILKNNRNIKVTDVKNENTTKEQNIDINNAMVQELYNIFKLSTDSDSCYMSVDSLNNSNLVKLRIAYNNISDSLYNNVNCGELELYEGGICGSMEHNSEMLKAYGNNDMVKFRELEKQNYTDSISAEVMERKLKLLFGSDFSVKHESFGYGHLVEPSCYVMKYDENKKLYARFMCEGGGTCGGVSQELLSATKKDNKLYINTKVTEYDNQEYDVKYTFKKDTINENYVFEKVEKLQ